MNYNIKAHPTKYNGVQFRSRLEARWAAFFDLAGWEWEYEPIDLMGWSPDFRVVLPRSHSECNGDHVLIVEVKPYSTLEDFAGHPCMDYPFGGPENRAIPADASACFGANPRTTQWQMVHGAGGGTYSVETWGNMDVDGLWKQAGNIVQWHKQ